MKRIAAEEQVSLNKFIASFRIPELRHVLFSIFLSLHWCVTWNFVIVFFLFWFVAHTLLLKYTLLYVVIFVAAASNGVFLLQARLAELERLRKEAELVTIIEYLFR